MRLVQNSGENLVDLGNKWAFKAMIWHFSRWLLSMREQIPLAIDLGQLWPAFWPITGDGKLSLAV